MYMYTQSTCLGSSHLASTNFVSRGLIFILHEGGCTVDNGSEPSMASFGREREWEVVMDAPVSSSYVIYKGAGLR
jgi:hypothetical protein